MRASTQQGRPGARNTFVYVGEQRGARGAREAPAHRCVPSTGHQGSFRSEATSRNMPVRTHKHTHTHKRTTVPVHKYVPAPRYACSHTRLCSHTRTCACTAHSRVSTRGHVRTCTDPKQNPLATCKNKPFVLKVEKIANKLRTSNRFYRRLSNREVRISKRLL